MRALLAALCLFSAHALAQNNLYLVPPANCSSTNASCSSSSLTVSSASTPQYNCTNTSGTGAQGACGFSSALVATGSIDRAFSFNVPGSMSGNDRIMSFQQSGSEKFSFSQAGSMYFGSSLNMSLDFENGLSMGGISMVSSTQPVGFYSSATAANTPFILKAGADHTSGAHTLFTDDALGTENTVASVRFDGAYRFEGVSTASLTACGAGIRELQYDATTNTLKYCNGTTYAELTSKISNTATLDFGSIAIANCADLTISVTGATTADTVALGVPNVAMVTGSQFQAWVSAADTVSVRHCCNGAATCDPASGTFTADVF